MAEYYFMSQLPSLDGVSENMALPITEERFFELCQRFLGEKAWGEMSKLTLTPPKGYEKSTSDLVDAWYRYERDSADIGKGLGIKVDKSEGLGIVG